MAKQMGAVSGRFLATETNENAARVMLDELLRWSQALRVLQA